MTSANPRLVLASASEIRRQLLEGAGLSVSVAPARIDEAALKAAMLAERAPPRDIADKLAETKALKVARRFPDAMVLGADQVLIHGSTLFDKPLDTDQARAQLKTLRDGEHRLLSAVVAVVAGQPVWRHVGEARLVMRDFSDGFLDDYLAAEGDLILSSVGGYRLEGRGAQLFSRVDGDCFSILGLPLLPTLDLLRRYGFLPS